MWLAQLTVQQLANTENDVATHGGLSWDNVLGPQ